MPDTIADSFDHRLRAAALNPSRDQYDQMQGAFVHLSRMLAKLPQDLGFADEPANAFTADALPGGDA